MIVIRHGVKATGGNQQADIEWKGLFEFGAIFVPDIWIFVKIQCNNDHKILQCFIHSKHQDINFFTIIY